jgi:siroheme synthase
MIRAARRGRRVVRLKGGDPFVFGRGGEEALALRDAGIPFEIVPGVTSLLSGPALAGIPVTHRGMAASVLVTTGHDVAAFAATIRGLPQSGVTLVVAMGYARRDALAGTLLDAGWLATTPVAMVAGASLPGQQTWRGTLARLAAGEGTRDGDAPTLIVVGDVAGMTLVDRDAVERDEDTPMRRSEG